MTIFNPQNAYRAAGDEDQNLIRHQIVEVEAAGTILEGQLVVLNASRQAIVATTSVDVWRPIGVAQNSVVAGQVVRVAKGGYVDNVRAQGAISAGARIERSGTTAGSVASTTTDANRLGHAISAAAADRVDVWFDK